MPYYPYNDPAGFYGAYEGQYQQPPPPQRNQTSYASAASAATPVARHVVSQTPQYYQATSPHVVQTSAGTYYQHPNYCPPVYGQTQSQQTSSQVLQHQQFLQQSYQPQQQSQVANSQGLHLEFPQYLQPTQLPAQVQHQQPHLPHRSSLHQVHSAPHQASTSQPPRRDHSPKQTVHASTNFSSDPRIESQHRPVARVVIPVARPSTLSAEQNSMPRSPKRRRSNEGNVIPVRDAPPHPQRSSASQRPEAAPSTSSAVTESPMSQTPSTPTSHVDYQATLLSLSDEYVSAAYGLSASIDSGDDSDERLDQYHQLMALGMGCLESLLNNYRHADSRREARIRLRLATLLHEETENATEAEEILSKGIVLCERSRLSDLKYAMHHLSARIMFRSSPKAAMKSIENIITEVEALGLMHWVYVFRLFRVTLGIHIEGHAETSALLMQLAATRRTAEESSHVSVLILTAALEAIVQLRSGNPEAIELAQRALAAARTHQLSPEMKRLPQIRALLDCLDVALRIMQFNADQVAASLLQMHENLDTATREPGWHKDGTFILALGIKAPADVDADTGGILRKTDSDEIAVASHWMPQGQLYALGFLLSGLGNMHKESKEAKATRFFQEGLKLSAKLAGPALESLAASSARLKSQTTIVVATRLALAFAQCSRSEWVAGEKTIHDLRRYLSETGHDPDHWTTRVMQYIEAMCKHGVGELEDALALYSSPELAFSSSIKRVTAMRDLQALATLNRLLLSRHLKPAGLSSAEIDACLAQLEPYCLAHPSRALAAAFSLLKATLPSTSIIKTKQHLQAAVTAARAAANSQILCMAMNLMTHSWFSGIVGEQAEKSARTGRSLARTARDPLWMAVADRMYAETMELAGNKEEAEAARKEVASAMGLVPVKVRELLEDTKAS